MNRILDTRDIQINGRNKIELGFSTGMASVDMSIHLLLFFIEGPEMDFVKLYTD